VEFFVLAPDTQSSLLGVDEFKRCTESGTALNREEMWNLSRALGQRWEELPEAKVVALDAYNNEARVWVSRAQSRGAGWPDNPLKFYLPSGISDPRLCAKSNIVVIVP
jgi:hypothetical protein